MLGPGLKGTDIRPDHTVLYIRGDEESKRPAGRNEEDRSVWKIQYTADIRRIGKVWM
jgi:hypothetical protein